MKFIFGFVCLFFASCVLLLNVEKTSAEPIIGYFISKYSISSGETISNRTTIHPGCTVFEIIGYFSHANDDYYLVRLPDGMKEYISTKNGSFYKTKTEIPKCEEKIYSEWEKKYDELMDQAWGGKKRYSISPQYSYKSEKEKETICVEIIKMTQRIYYDAPFKYEKTPDWREEYKKCLKNLN